MELSGKLSQSFRYWMDCAFKSTKKLHRDILDWLNKSKTPGNCGFPLANLQKGLSLDFVP